MFKTELRAAEVDPRFKIWARQIAVSRIFCPRCMKLIEHGLQYVDTWFYKFQTSRTKIGEVSLILDTSYFLLHDPF